MAKHFAEAALAYAKPFLTVSRIGVPFNLRDMHLHAGQAIQSAFKGGGLTKGGLVGVSAFFHERNGVTMHRFGDPEIAIRDPAKTGGFQAIEELWPENVARKMVLEYKARLAQKEKGTTKKGLQELIQKMLKASRETAKLTNHASTQHGLMLEDSTDWKSLEPLSPGSTIFMGTDGLNLYHHLEFLDSWTEGLSMKYALNQIHTEAVGETDDDISGFGIQLVK